MRVDIMTDNDICRKALEKGELMKLSCSPRPYELLDEAHKKQTIASWIWALGVGIVLIGGYAGLCFYMDVELKPGAIIICAIIPLAMAWGPVGDKKNMKKLRYAITNKRVITANIDGNKIHSLAISDIDAARLERSGNETSHLRFGSSTFSAPLKKLPDIALNGKYETKDSEKTYTGLVFYNISEGDGKEIYDLLKSEVKTIESV
jgi:hypothetical protein